MMVRHDLLDASYLVWRLGHESLDQKPSYISRRLAAFYCSPKFIYFLVPPFHMSYPNFARARNVLKITAAHGTGAVANSPVNR